MAHDFLAPSSASKWRYCAASPEAELKYPQEDTEDTLNGNAVHWVCSETLISYKTGGNVKLSSDFLGKQSPEGVVIDQEMIDAADVYINEILRVCQSRGLVQEMHVEEHVKIDRVSEYNSGTPDCWVWDARTNTVYEWDFKYGHEYVEIFENWQFIDYAIGVVDYITGGNGIVDQNLNVVMIVIQPRCYKTSSNINEWKLKASDLRGYANQLKNAADLAVNGPRIFTTGSHCKYCSARHACEGAQEAAMKAIDITNKVGVTGLNELDPHSLGVELAYLQKAATSIAARLTGLELQVESSIMSGNPVPGWECKPTFSRKAWNKPILEVITMGSMFGQDLSKPGALTPKQAIDKGIDETIINVYSGSKATGFKLTKSDNNLARKVFGD